MKKRKIRWMIVCLLAAVLFGIGAIRFYLRAEIMGVIIYGASTIIFLALAYAYHKGYLK